MYIKLSPAQIKAMLELAEKGETNARTRTLESLANLGFVVVREGKTVTLTPDGREWCGHWMEMSRKSDEAFEDEINTAHSILLKKTGEVFTVDDMRRWWAEARRYDHIPTPSIVLNFSRAKAWVILTHRDCGPRR